MKVTQVSTASALPESGRRTLLGQMEKIEIQIGGLTVTVGHRVGHDPNDEVLIVETNGILTAQTREGWGMIVGKG